MMAGESNITKQKNQERARGNDVESRSLLTSLDDPKRDGRHSMHHLKERGRESVHGSCDTGKTNLLRGS